MSEVFIRAGETRGGFSMMYHEIFDLYHPYIGDKATLYYLYLLRFRNHESEKATYGRSWKGRTSVVEKFQLSFSTLPIIDSILEAVGLISLEYKSVGRGKDKIVYVVNDPLDREKFRASETNIRERLREVSVKHPNIGKLLGKENGIKLLA
jgi:replication initiation and membrane attachment protein DnaB